MQKLSFFYEPSNIYQLSVQALRHRKFSISEKDAETGVIKASLRQGFLKPKVNIELHIEKQSTKLTSLKIESQIKKGWLNAGDDITLIVEERFINSLYKFINSKFA